MEFDPVRGSEASKRRPAVIVSNDTANEVAARMGRGVITVVPLTSNTQRVFGFQVHVPAPIGGVQVDSKAQAEQIRSVDVERVGSAFGSLPGAIMRAVDDAIRLHLSL